MPSSADRRTTRAQFLAPRPEQRPAIAVGLFGATGRVADRKVQDREPPIRRRTFIERPKLSLNSALSYALRAWLVVMRFDGR